MSLKAKIEAVIYASEEPVTLAQITGLLGHEAQAELDHLDASQQSLALSDSGAAPEDPAAAEAEHAAALDRALHIAAAEEAAHLKALHEHADADAAAMRTSDTLDDPIPELAADPIAEPIAEATPEPEQGSEAPAEAKKSATEAKEEK